MQHLLIDLFCQATCREQVGKHTFTFLKYNLRINSTGSVMSKEKELEATIKTHVNENDVPQTFVVTFWGIVEFLIAIL